MQLQTLSIIACSQLVILWQDDFLFLLKQQQQTKKQKKQGIGNIYGYLDSKRVMENQHGKIHQNDR